MHLYRVRLSDKSSSAHPQNSSERQWQEGQRRKYPVELLPNLSQEPSAPNSGFLRNTLSRLLPRAVQAWNPWQWDMQSSYPYHLSHFRWLQPRGWTHYRMWGKKAVWYTTGFIMGCLREEPKLDKGMDLGVLGRNKSGKIEKEVKNWQLHVNSLLFSTLVQMCLVPELCSLSYLLTELLSNTFLSWYHVNVYRWGCNWSQTMGQRAHLSAVQQLESAALQASM